MSPVRVVIVDDDELTRIGVRTILETAPEIEVVGEAGDAEAAIDAARRLEPDVVLMDVRLPSVDGIEATHRIIDSWPGTQAPPRVLMLTTFELDEYVYRSLKAGASGFLLKRTRAEDLIGAVHAVANGDELPAASDTRRLIASFTTNEPSQDGALVSSLTDRETEVLLLIAQGLSNREIATQLGVSVETIKTHVKHIYNKCALRDRVQAVILAYESGIVPPGDRRS